MGRSCESQVEKGKGGNGSLGGRKGMAKPLGCGSSRMHRGVGRRRTYKRRKLWLLVVLGEPWKVFKQGSGMIPFIIMRCSVGAEVELEGSVAGLLWGLFQSRPAVMCPELGSWGGRSRFRDV